jgi:hypothetical protein
MEFSLVQTYVQISGNSGKKDMFVCTGRQNRARQKAWPGRDSARGHSDAGQTSLTSGV